MVCTHLRIWTFFDCSPPPWRQALVEKDRYGGHGGAVMITMKVGVKVTDGVKQAVASKPIDVNGD